MNKYEKAIEYFFKQMERGLIEDDEQQNMYEVAINALLELNKQEKGENNNDTI